jgi:hypothetical protein
MHPLQRQEPFTSGRFLASKLCDFGSRSTDVHGGPESTHCRRSRLLPQ